MTTNYEPCRHVRTEIRKKEFVNGTTNFGWQCLDCGAHGGPQTWMKKCDAPGDAPLWDENISDTVWKQRLQAQEEEKLRSRAAFFEEHNEYMRTAEWQSLRRRLAERENHLCQGCRRVPGSVAHHLTYVRFKKELLIDLAWLCNDCHERCHAHLAGRS